MNKPENCISYEQLLDESENVDFISYEQLLKTQEWAQRRNEILLRDKFTCTNCGKGQSDTLIINSKKHDIWWVEDFLHTDIYKPTDASKVYTLHIHHKFYIIEKLPWDYPDDALITLCNWCHSELHKKENIPIYSQRDGQLEKIPMVKCSRCAGAGHLPDFTHIEGGICFKCRGNRYLKVKPDNSEPI